MLNASKNCPFIIYISARVVPQDGQGKPVIFLNKQTLIPESEEVI
jgi:hypothetical protein